ncbi:MAG: PilZ domain-containing protein [Acidobacteria bacterium]|nr:MAG: PilZ domain-containing protein [Acidobacteriota bacterium]
MSRTEARRACRHPVEWPARVRLVTEVEWHPGRVVNLSVTGVLLQTDEPYKIGERVEVEIDFLTQPESRTVVAGVGSVVRGHAAAPRRAAIHFDLGCAPRAATQ